MSFAFQRINGEQPFADNDFSEHDFEEFKEICRPVVEYIQKKHGSPHCRAIIDRSSAVLVKDLQGVEFKPSD